MSLASNFEAEVGAMPLQDAGAIVPMVLLHSLGEEEAEEQAGTMVDLPEEATGENDLSHIEDA
jgi:hypothetical protein